jgi:Na+:H+ antiporter, NhaA family
VPGSLVGDAVADPAGGRIAGQAPVHPADGPLAVFFFVAGLELKREFVAGDLRDPRRAALPVAAAFGGVAAPALIYTLINAVTATGAPRGWAVPTATDIAFALAVLGLISAHLPSALRTFLLTLAVVDDLIAIAIIAIFFRSEFHPLPLLLALLPLAGFAVLVQAPGAGVVGPAAVGRADLGPGARLGGPCHGLVVGKTLGILGATWAVQRLTRAELADELSWWDVLGLAMLGGIGFTVSLLISELAFGADSEHAKLGVLAGSVLAAVTATVLLRVRGRHCQREAARS